MQLYLNFSLIVGTWGDGGPSVDSVLPCGNRYLFWSHPRDDGAGLQEDEHALRCRNNSQVGGVTWGMNAFVYMETKKEFYNCHWTKWQKNVVLKDKTGRFCDKCHRHRAIRAMEQREESRLHSSRGLAGTYLAVINDKIPSFAVTPHSPMLPWTIRHAAWILTRYNVTRDTLMTPYEKIRGQKYRKELLPLGERVLARRPGANVNQLMQPWVTGLWLGGDTLSDEHLIGTAAGIMRSRAVLHLQEPARWVPAALNAMLSTPPCSPHHESFPADLVHRDQRTRNQLKPERCQDSLRFLQHQASFRSQK